MDRSTPSLSSSLRRLMLAMLAGCVAASAAFAQQLDESALPRSNARSNGQPFPETRLPALAQANPGFEVPPLVDRPIGLDEGPRLFVGRFELNGAVDRPEYGIYTGELDLILRNQEEQPPEGYTVNQMQAIADQITMYYRERGLVLAQAYVPAQDVENNIVRIDVMEGTLGGIDVEGNKIYRNDVISKPFASLQGQPVTENSIEEALLTVQDFPGLTVFGTFRQGTELGQTNLLVRVTDEDRLRITPMVDNYGTDSTGKTRLSLRFDINNPFGARDRISWYALQTFDPQNGVYGGLNYEVMTASGGGAFGVGLARNTFDVTDPTASINLDLSGEVKQVNAFHRMYFSHSRTRRSSGTLDVSTSKATTKQPGADPVDKLQTLSYTYDYFAVGRNRRSVNVGYFRALFGDNTSATPSRFLTNREPVTGNYGKFEFSYQRLQRLGQNHALLLRMDGQYSRQPIVALEQYVAGGPANVRAYPVAEQLLDTGGSMSFEWIINAPGFANHPAGRTRNGTNRDWGDIFQLSLFYDYADGRINKPLPLQRGDHTLKGYGIGLQFSQSDAFYVRLDAARPSGGPVPSNGKDTQYYLSANVSF